MLAMVRPCDKRGESKRLNECFAVADERVFHDSSRKQLAANVDFDTIAGRSRNASKADGLFHRRRERAAGELAVAGGSNDSLMTAQYAALFEDETDELALHTLGTLRFERGTADEITLRWIERDGPSEAGLERRQVLVHIVAVQIHAGFQTQSVARAQATFSNPSGLQ